MFKAMKNWGRKLKRFFSGESTGRDASAAGAAIVAGWGLERLWDKFSQWLKDNPEQAESFAHAVTYVRQWATKTPAPQTWDLYLDAWTRLGEEDPALLGLLVHKLARIGGAPIDADQLNAAQNLFVVLAVQYPERPENLKVDSPNRAKLVELTFRRLRMFARMPEQVWNETCDVLNLTAPEREKAFTDFLKSADAEIAKVLNSLRRPLRGAIRTSETSLIQPTARAARRFRDWSRNLPRAW